MKLINYLLFSFCLLIMVKVVDRLFLDLYFSQQCLREGFKKIAKLSLNSTQLNSTSTQSKAEVVFISIWSSNPPTRRKSFIQSQLNFNSSLTSTQLNLNSTSTQTTELVLWY